MKQFLFGLMIGLLLTATGSMAYTIDDEEEEFGFSHRITPQQQQSLYNLQQQLNGLPHHNLIVPVLPPC